MSETETEFLERLSKTVRDRPPLRFGRLELKTRYLLSPLAGYTNLSFRRIVREVGGVGLATTDLVNARGLMAGSQKTKDLIATCAEDAPFAVQIFGHEKSFMQEAAGYLQEYGADSIDINMGCPVDRITKGGAGAGMMCKTDETIGLVRAVVEATSLPVTVKMRLGWDDTQITAPKFAREFEQAGVTAIMIHGRTREQGFRGSVNRDGIRQVVEAVESIPVIGNGDIRSVYDAAVMFAETGCNGVSVGRGALANPWIFLQLATWETTGQIPAPGNFNQRLELVKRQFRYLEEQLGAENGLIQFRRTAHWYLKAMKVRSSLRHQVQLAKSRDEFDAIIEKIEADGPVTKDRTGLLPEFHIPVPGGPVERW